MVCGEGQLQKGDFENLAQGHLNGEARSPKSLARSGPLCGLAVEVAEARETSEVLPAQLGDRSLRAGSGMFCVPGHHPGLPDSL